MPLVPLALYKTPRKAAAARTNQVANVVAPVGGLNLRDPISAMAPTDALIMDDMIPRQSGAELRAGYTLQCQDIPFSVGSLMSYTAGNNANKRLFAAAGGNIYEVSGSTPTLSKSGTGSTDDLWFSAQFSTGADTFLVAVSPSAGYWTYSIATGWVKQTVTGLPANPKTVFVWKRRLWFTCENDTNVYYMGTVNTITGTATAFPMGAQLRNGGYVAAGFNWTLEAGVSMDDRLVFIGTQGDVVVWEGTDPTSTSTFNLVGVWYLGPVPTKGTFFTPLGGDVLVVSEVGGLTPMSRIVNGQYEQNTYEGPAAKILSALRPLVRLGISTAQWDVQFVASQNLLIIKPPKQGDDWIWYAMDISTNSWCRITGIPSSCMATQDGSLYVADGTKVYRALYGDSDAGSPIEADLLTAFNAYGAPANLKKWSMVRPVFIASNAPSVKLQVNTQYSFTNVDGSPSFTDPDSSSWDSGSWDTAAWFGATNTYEAWAGANAMGYIGALRMKVRGAPGTLFTSYHSMFDVGGVM